MDMRAGGRYASRLGSALIAVILTGCAAQGQPAVPTKIVASDPNVIHASSPLGSYLEGQHAQHEHDYGAAAKYFGQAMSQDPSDYELINKTFLFDLSEGRIDEAKTLADKINQIDPASPLPALVIILGRLQSGDGAGADTMAQSMPREGIHRFVSPLVQAWAKVADNQPDQAILALAPLKDIQGFAPLADFHVGLINDYLGRTADAEAAYLRVVQSTTRTNWRSIEALGGLYERAGRTDEARALYQRFVDENRDSDLAGVALARLASGTKPPARVAGPAEGAAEALFDLASLLDQNETSDLALVYGRLALYLKPNFPLAQLLVADILEAEHRAAEALAINQSIPPQSPYGWPARLRAVNDLDALDRSDEAIAELKAMAAERPDRPDPLIQLGDLLRSKNRFAEAVTAYDGAIERIAKPEPRHWALFYSRGVALERAGNWPRAEADLQHALELQPEQPLVLNYLGYSWIDKGTKLSEGMRMVQRAVELRPNDGYIVDSLGWAYYRLGNYAQATQQLEHATELRPADPTINDHLGDAYWQSGRHTEARNQWRRALQFGPEADEVKTIEAKLDKGLVKPEAPGTAQGG
jgi:tetratricopeptide (TPR) repeat protein